MRSGVKQKRKIALLVKEILKKKRENYNINYVFCTDEYLLRINKEYLNHKKLTDIITSDLSAEDSDLLNADIYSFRWIKDGHMISWQPIRMLNFQHRENLG